MVKYYDISQWEEHQYYGTGGTRDKSVVENPENGYLYYFKTSLKKKVIDYKYEFWSEVIASEIGDTLGLDILHYDVAWKDDRLGCLSKSMIDSQKEELQEGYKWLTGFDAKYDINDKDAYTFQIIERLLTTRFKQEGFIKDLIEIIVFDSIIGNGDRHQENWSIIVTNKLVDKSTIFRKRKPISETLYSFAPIYDSGSSMGRELTDEQVSQMLRDNAQLEAYVKRGQSEIHWAGERGKQKHLDLISKISSYGYKDTVLEIINSMRAKYDIDTIAGIINNIDDCLPVEHSLLKIPQTRKEFLIKLVSLRFNKLFELQL
ncbi:MAG: hypothetical protein MJZ06_09550 [Bacteroidaceae bacterium]|nr:hypothetical protein [Bacteroidaceae bacterium]